MRIVVAGTGTGVGKTTFSVALLRALRASGRAAVGWKPVETGGDADARALAGAAGATEPPAGVRLAAPLAPSIAARLEGRVVELAPLVVEARSLGAATEVLVVETAGGLFSPLREDGTTNAELAVALRPDVFVLVAANRLGVLHDVEACRRALAAMELGVDVVILTGAAARDASAEWNAVELRRVATVVEMPEDSLDASSIEVILGAARAQR